jgi:eukaryotic-like serine/threonine-protein kinase
MIGEVIDEKYKITRLIGEGGMGAVFEGENLLISRRVAIKVLHAAMAMNEQTVERFQREARAAGRIGNDHILEVLDLGKLPDGDHYMVLEYLDGEPLSGRITRLGRLAPEQLAPLMTQVLAGLGAAHQAGIIHRDLKPDNLFILKEKAGHKDFMKIIDFGISKFNPLSGDDAQKKMTQTGAIMGTPYYMSPEQARGSLQADARSDLYSIGVIMYEAVTGEVPFDGQTINELMFAIALNEPKPLDEVVPGLDPGFKHIIEKAMLKDKDRRYQSADEFQRDLATWMGDPRALAAGALAAPAAHATAAATEANVARGAQGSSATTSTWSKSQADATIPTNNAPIVMATLIGTAVLLGGGGFVAYKIFGGDSSAPVDVAGAETVEVPPPSAAPAAAPAEVLPPPVAQPSVAAAPTAEPPPVPKPDPAEEPAKPAAPAPLEATARPAALAPKPRATASRPVTAQPAPAPAPKPATEPAPQPAEKRGSFSRFGY